MLSHKTILVPTDFRVASLHTLRLALEQLDELTVDVVLLHCQTMDDSITELLFYSPKQIISELMTDDFRDALSILHNRFEHKIGEIKIELFHGYAQSAFDMLLNRLEIDGIYVSESYPLQLGKRAFDPRRYIKKSEVPCYEVVWDRQLANPEEDKLENLFL